MRKLFVSYARENKRDVDQLVEHLRTMGYDTWVDAALRGGQDWWDEILGRIADTDVVIAIYSSAVLNSTACGREFEWATALGKPIIPVAVEPPPSALPRRFARRQIIDYSQPAERDRAALQLQGALATVPPAPPLPDPLPEPPAAPLSYLTDLIDLITQPSVVDHDQQHQILRQLEPALTSFDPLERQGGRDILQRFSRRHDLYADVDRAITRLKQLSEEAAPDHGKLPTQNTVSAAEQSEVQVDTAPAELADQSADTSTQDVGEPIGTSTATSLSSPDSTPEPELTHGDKPSLEGADVAADLAGGNARDVDDDTREPSEATPTPGSDAETRVLLTDEPAPVLRPFTQSDEKTAEVGTSQPLLQRLSQRTKIAVITGAVALVGVIAAAVGIPAIVGNRSPTSSERSYAAQVVLPFTGLDRPQGVAADSTGNIYVTDDNDRVLKLPAGAVGQQVLPFTGLNKPDAVAVDSTGTLYVTDWGNNRVLKLPAGAVGQQVLPFTGLNDPDAVAVDSTGTLYVTDWGNNRVLKLPAGAPNQEVLPFTGLNSPAGVAVDSTGTLYVTDWGNNRVLKLPTGEPNQEVLPFTGLNSPAGVAVDSTGTLYVTDWGNNRVLKLPAGAVGQQVLPFTGLNNPDAVAVDSTGTVYVTDYGNNQVLKLPVQ